VLNPQFPAEFCALAEYAVLAFPRAMVDRLWTRAASLACVAVALSCGGKAASDATGSTGGASGNAGANGNAGAGSAGAGAGGMASNNCTGPLDAVADIGDVTCPATLCAANALAATCGSLPPGIITSRATACGSLQGITLSLSPTRSKSCYYDTSQPLNSAPLVGASASTDDNSYCGLSSKQISAGTLPDNCAGAPVSTLCDLTGSVDGDGAPDGGAEAPPSACFNEFDHACSPCCPATPPDCTGKPDGYPGYSCTPAPGSGNTFCACACGGGSWQCGC